MAYITKPSAFDENILSGTIGALIVESHLAYTRLSFLRCFWARLLVQLPIAKMNIMQYTSSSLIVWIIKGKHKVTYNGWPANFPESYLCFSQSSPCQSSISPA